MSELIDNRAHRISVLKEIIQHLHAGAAPELVKEQLRKIIGETDATEIMAMEQQLMAEGMPVDEVPPPASVEPGHPLRLFEPIARPAKVKECTPAFLSSFVWPTSGLWLRAH